MPAWLNTLLIYTVPFAVLIVGGLLFDRRAPGPSFWNVTADDD